MTLYLIHCFSFNMLKHLNSYLDNSEITEAHFKQIKDECVSVIGIKELANILDVPYNNNYIELRDGDEFIQVIIDGQIPKGSTTLPRGVDLKYIYTKIIRK